MDGNQRRRRPNERIGMGDKGIDAAPTKVWLVVLNWNNGRDTVECLDSVLSVADPAIVGVVTCDNGSTDDSMQRIHQWAVQQGVALPSFDWRGGEFQPTASVDPSTAAPAAPRFVLLQTGANLGFAGGNNIGIRFVQQREEFDQILLLNNDALLAPGAVSAMAARMQQDAGVGMCGCTVVYHHTPDRVQAWGGAHFRPCLARANHLGAHAPVSAAPDPADVERQLDYIIGAALMISRPCLQAIGLMEERYFLYYEEIDWAVRARRAGYTLAFAPGAVVFHKEGGTSGSSSNQARRSLLSEHYMVRSALLFTRKFYPLWLPTVLAFLFAKTMQAWLTQRDGRRAWVRLRAMVGLALAR